MLKQRIITALILIPLTVWAIFGLPNVYLAWLLGALVMLGAWEWTRMIPLHHLATRLTYLALTGTALIATGIYLYRMGALTPVLIVALIWWLFAFLWVVSYRAGSANKDRLRSVKYVAGFLTLVPAWGALVAIHADSERGPWMLLFVMVLMWVADSGAYFSGRKWGRHKLAPYVSPGKTWEGVAGALVASTLYGFAGGWQFGYQGHRLGVFVVLCIVTVAFSILGDLWESLLKRDQGIKDSGTLLPGHGGVLDRIDSLTSGAPIYLLGLLLMEWWR